MCLGPDVSLGCHNWLARHQFDASEGKWRPCLVEVDDQFAFGMRNLAKLPGDFLAGGLDGSIGHQFPTFITGRWPTRSSACRRRMTMAVAPGTLFRRVEKVLS